MSRNTLVLTFVAAAALAGYTCSGDTDNEPRDGGTDAVDAAAFDSVGADEPFGRACTNIGKKCKDQDKRGWDLYCVAVQGGPTGKGFCTPQCTDLGSECYGVPNGQWAQCIIEDNSAGDAGPATKYCAFLCANGNSSWTCPGTLECGKKNKQGVAICHAKAK